jgi:DNA topoisomerase-3
LILVIAEKKGVAELFTKILKDDFRRANGYYVGKKYIITFAYGHLVNSKNPDEYEHFEGWKWESIPFYPPNGNIDYVKPNKTDFDTVRVRQLGSIDEAYKKHTITKVINACDAEREGELIFWEIYYYLKMKAPVERLWLQSQEDSDVLAAFDNLKQENFYVPKREASFARQYADYLLGQNLTIAFSVKVDNLLHIGRVQTPTLSLLVKRKLEIDNFISKDYFELSSEFGNKYSGKWFKDNKSNVRFDEKEKMNEIVEKIKGKEAKVVIKEIKPESEKPKELFNLGGLQKEANRKLGFTVKKTLEVAQELYDKYKVLSYPRTSSAYLMESQVAGFPQILKSLSIDEYKEFTADIIDAGIPTGKHFVDDKKVSDHYAIIPTKKQVNWSEFRDDPKSGVTKKELHDLYDLVAKRFLSVFYPKAQYEKTEIVTEVEGETFKTSGRILLDLGWKKVYAKEKPEEKENKKETEDDKELPFIDKGEVNNVTLVKPESKQTKPPSHYNDATIVAAMESAKDYLEEDELKEDLKDAGAKIGLGTEATRATIIENLFNRNYAERVGKQIIATDLGVKLINIAPVNLKSPEITAIWEAKLKRMEKDEFDRDEFQKEIRDFVEETINELKAKEITEVFASRKSNNRESFETCPKCKGEIYEFEKGFACSNSTKENKCFLVWKEILKKKITQKDIKEMLSDGKTKLIKGFKKNDGTKFDAHLKLNSEMNGTELVFADGEDQGFNCSTCGTEIQKFPKMFVCQSNTREKPCFSFPAVYGGKKLGKKEIKSIVDNGETEFLTFVSNKDGIKKNYQAKLTRKGNAINMEFKPKEKVEVKETSITCPKCHKGKLKSQGKIYKCEDEKCDLVLFKEMSQRVWKDEEIKELLAKGEIGPLEGFISKDKKPYKAKVKWNPEKNKIEFNFNK